jgi:hypothetical protein
VAADKPQTYCPRLEGLVPWFLRLDVQILMNSLIISGYLLLPKTDPCKALRRNLAYDDRLTDLLCELSFQDTSL